MQKKIYITNSNGSAFGTIDVRLDDEVYEKHGKINICHAIVVYQGTQLLMKDLVGNENLMDKLESVEQELRRVLRKDLEEPMSSELIKQLKEKGYE